MPVVTLPARIAAPPLLALLLTCSFLWASSYLMMKLLGSGLAPVPMAAVRGLMGAGFLAAWLLARGQGVLPRGREWRDWLLLGIFQGIVPNSLTAYALTEITTGLAAMIQAASPLIVAFLAHLMFAEERLSWRRGAGVATGFAGMAILLGPAAFASGSASPLGPLAMAATALSYAIGVLYVRTIPNPRPARLALGQQAFSGLPTLVIVLLVSGGGAFAMVPEHALSLLVFGLFGTALPILIYMHILRTAGPTRGSMNTYLIPFWTLLLGTLLLHESVGPREVLGGAVVLAGVAIVTLTKGRPRD